MSDKTLFLKSQSLCSKTQNPALKYFRFLPLLIAAAATSLGLRIGIILISLHVF